MFDFYRKQVQSSGKYLSQQLKQQSQDIMNDTFTNDIAYRRVLINDEYVDAKFTRESNFTVDQDLPTYRLQFRPGVRYDNGTLVGIYNEDTCEDQIWLITGNTEDGYFTKYYIVLCDYTIKWIYERHIYTQPVSIRLKKSYSSGTWTPTTSSAVATFIDNQLGFVCSLNENTQYLDMNDRFFISFNDLHPSVFKISKLETGLKKGLIFVTLEQDFYNTEKDSIELKLCDTWKLGLNKDPDTANDVPDYTYSAVVLPDDEQIYLNRDTEFEIRLMKNDDFINYINSDVYITDTDGNSTDVATVEVSGNKLTIHTFNKKGYIVLHIKNNLCTFEKKYRVKSVI